MPRSATMLLEVADRVARVAGSRPTRLGRLSGRSGTPLSFGMQPLRSRQDCGNACLHQDKGAARRRKNSGELVKIGNVADSRDRHAKRSADQLQVRVPETRADGPPWIVPFLMDANRAVDSVLGQDNLQIRIVLKCHREFVPCHQKATIADQTDDRPLRLTQCGGDRCRNAKNPSRQRSAPAAAVGVLSAQCDTMGRRTNRHPP